MKQPIRELNAVNPRFRIDIERLKKGRTLVGYRFICTDLAHSNPVCDTELGSKIALDDIERLKQKYFAEYAKRLAERAQSRQPYESLAMIDFEIFEQMKSEGFEI